jgi:DNA polymerase-3 subunit alpha
MQFSLNTNAKEISRKQLLEWEKELIGVYVSRHPLSYLADTFKERVKHATSDITEDMDKQKVVIGGTIKEARRITTKKGDTMCVIQLEDMYGTIGVTVFPKVYEQTAELWVEDSVVIIHGDVQVRRDEPGILCNSVVPVKSVEEEMNRKHYQVWLTVHLSGSNDISVSDDIMKVQDVYRFIQERPGHDHYEILVENGEWAVRLAPGDNTMYYSDELHAKLEEILGKGAVLAKEVDIVSAA